ncbi:ABC transporter permease [Catellatospora methionotrophica]|uniref:ABC transporter permease n=2 Tax=Catellatospora methionotrophica TaxID=121620 RepID=A0A8J3LC87_9ACTN|nr:ABC transporter permease [Catellatospora methionotrophica]GIG11995.1 ABC transporter permease [Catellatospora methionotrophica]
MMRFVLRRLAYALLTIWGVSFVAFIIIQLPPGDFLTTSIERMGDDGAVGEAQIAVLREQYGLDQPIWVQYFKWISGIVLHGDFGQSFVYHRPVAELIGQRLPLTIALSIATIVFTWAMAVPIGIYSAVRQYSLGDYAVTILGFLGLAIPSFLVALVLLYVSYNFFGQDVGGLFSERYIDAPWSFGKVVDLLKHMWIPVAITGLAGTASLIRVMRANLLDELRKPYVAAARARGNSETRLIVKYPVRVAIAPLLSTLGAVLPAVVSSGEVVAIVLSLQTTGPLLLSSLQTQDMYLAGSLIFAVSVLTVVGTLISDLMLGWADPRIRHRYS